MCISEQVSAAGTWGSGQLRMAVDWSCPTQECRAAEAGALLLPVPTRHGWGLLTGTGTAWHLQPPHVQTKHRPEHTDARNPRSQAPECGWPGPGLGPAKGPPAPASMLMRPKDRPRPPPCSRGQRTARTRHHAHEAKGLPALASMLMRPKDRPSPPPCSRGQRTARTCRHAHEAKGLPARATMLTRPKDCPCLPPCS